MQHLQSNYKFWVSEEENPTSDYDLSKKGKGQTKDIVPKSSESSNVPESTNIDNNDGDNTWDKLVE